MIHSIGILGQGFVGTAVRETFRHFFTLFTFDRCHDAAVFDGTREDRIAKKLNGVSWILENVDGPIFICLPTPMRKDGSCDLGIVEDTVRQMEEYARRLGRNPVLILKSTVPPGTTTRLNTACLAVRICFNPEFLRETSYLEDFRTQNRILLGGPPEATTIAAEIFRRAFPDVPLFLTSATTAEMVKYVTNAFLAVKVSLANEFRGICDGLGIDFAEVIRLATLDPRLGASHWAVPGPDGKPGFGGSCFPKDLNALMSLAQTLGVLHHTMHGAWTTNLAVRPERDWEQLHGRAVNYK